MLRMLPAVVALFAYAASTTNAAVVFHIGGGETFSFQQNTGIHSLPIYISSDGADFFDAVEFFLAGSTPGVVPGNSDGDIVGSVGQAGMVGNAEFAVGSVERALNEYVKLDASFSEAVAVPTNAEPLENRQFASLFIDTSLLSPGTHTFSDAGFINVFRAGNEIDASIIAGNFQITAVPEPTSLAFVGLVGLGALVWHRRQAKIRAAAPNTTT